MRPHTQPEKGVLNSVTTLAQFASTYPKQHEAIDMHSHGIYLFCIKKNGQNEIAGI